LEYCRAQPLTLAGALVAASGPLPTLGEPTRSHSDG